LGKGDVGGKKEDEGEKSDTWVPHVGSWDEEEI
jgi:hypothetical protein